MTGSNEPSADAPLAVGTPLPPRPPVAFDAACVAAYAAASGDRNPIHLDPQAARRAGLDGPIVHGMLMMGQIEAAVRAWLPGHCLRRLETRFTRPLAVGGTLDIAARVVRVSGDAGGAITLRLVLRDGDAAILAIGEAEVARVDAPPAA